MVVCRVLGHKFKHYNMLSSGNNFCVRCNKTLWELTK
jgi:hypothetical protein